MNNGFKITRDENRCVACYECIIVCPQSGDDKPNSVIVAPQVEGKPPEINCIQNCLQCMTCWDFCRAQAIIFENHHAVKRLGENTAALAQVAKII